VISHQVFAALAPLVAERVFPGNPEFDTPRPFICYAFTGGDPVQFLDKSRGSKRNARIQVHVWADDFDQAEALMYAAEDALCGASGMDCSPLGEHRDADPPPGLLYAGKTQEFDVWADR
jgi:hypothetical protein